MKNKKMKINKMKMGIMIIYKKIINLIMIKKIISKLILLMKMKKQKNLKYPKK
jgi:hypothetical protein